MDTSITRRRFLAGLAAAGVVFRAPMLLAGPAGEPVTKPIPATGEQVPVIGMGTWRTFNVGHDEKLIAQRTEVLRIFFERGGQIVDSSPMYGTSERVLGRALETLGAYNDLFAATKVWTSDKQEGRDQARESQQLWGVSHLDLLQIHNLRGWEAHLETLKRMKAEGEVRYIGITTSHGRRHDEFAAIMEREPLDFVQLSYNILNRDAEQRLLPLARDKGIAVIANRPFQRGSLFDRFQSRPLPEWAADLGCENWAEFFLKYIVSHPDITCAIPATTREEHMRENMGALYGRMPDPDQRERMARYIEEL